MTTEVEKLHAIYDVLDGYSTFDKKAKIALGYVNDMLVAREARIPSADKVDLLNRNPKPNMANPYRKPNVGKDE